MTQRLRQGRFQWQACDGAQFLALRQHRAPRRKSALPAASATPHVEQPRRVERREQIERPPGQRFVGIDLREVAAVSLGRRLHQAAVPPLADADADIARVLPECGSPTLRSRRSPSGGDAAAEVDQIADCWPAAATRRRPSSRRAEVESADQMRLSRNAIASAMFSGVDRLRCRSEALHLRVGGEDGESVVRLGVAQAARGSPRSASAPAADRGRRTTRTGRPSRAAAAAPCPAGPAESAPSDSAARRAPPCEKRTARRPRRSTRVRSSTTSRSSSRACCAGIEHQIVARPSLASAVRIAVPARSAPSLTRAWNDQSRTAPRLCPAGKRYDMPAVKARQAAACS